MTKPQRWLVAVLMIVLAVSLLLAANNGRHLVEVRRSAEQSNAAATQMTAVLGRVERLLQRVDERAPAFKDKVSRADDDNQFQKAQLHAIAVHDGCALPLPVTRPVVPFPSDRP